MSSPEDRLEALASELRAAKPAASPELRQRVTAMRPEPRRNFLPRLSARRAAVVLVPACVVAGVGVAVVHGVVSGSTSARRAGNALSTVKGLPMIPAPPGGVPDVQKYKAAVPEPH